jgi:F0F1-type ATP synthase assembly protein I
MSASQRRQAWRGLDHGAVMGVELITAVLMWAGIGWLIDRWLGTGPWFFAIGALIGNAAGLYLIWLRAERMSRDDPASSPNQGDTL